MPSSSVYVACDGSRPNWQNVDIGTATCQFGHYMRHHPGNRRTSWPRLDGRITRRIRAFTPFQTVRGGWPEGTVQMGMPWGRWLLIAWRLVPCESFFDKWAPLTIESHHVGIDRITLTAVGTQASGESHPDFLTRPLGNRPIPLALGRRGGLEEAVDCILRIRDKYFTVCFGLTF